MPAAQDKFLPNEPNSGSLGDESYPWAELHTDRLFVNGEPVDLLAIAQTVPGIAGSNLPGHRAVRWDLSGSIILADPDSRLPATGIVREAVSAGHSIAVYTGGVVTGFSGLIPGSTYYLSAAGAVSATPANSLWQPLGTAISATELLVRIGLSVRL